MKAIATSELTVRRPLKNASTPDSDLQELGIDLKTCDASIKPFLRELLTYQHDPKKCKEIEDAIIGSKKEETFHTDFADFWRRFLDGDFPKTELLREKLKDKRLLILGGTRSDILIGKQCGSKDMISVNLYWYEKSTVVKPRPHDIPIYQVKDDMLNFISHLETSSVDAITINGIDKCIMRNQEYHDLLANEIERALIPDGIIFGFNSDSLESLSSSKSMVLSYENKGVSSAYIYLKKPTA